jgi:type IV pilus assembly protein PilE
MNRPLLRKALHGRGRQRGVTLLELIVTMVIVTILASIAIPSYSIFIRKSRRTDAKTALLDMASLEERFFSVNNAYSVAATDLGYAAFPTLVGSGYYTVSAPVVTPAVAPTAALPSGTPATYILTAVPTAGTDQVNDTACLNFILTSAGAKSNSGPDLTCWN